MAYADLNRTLTAGAPTGIMSRLAASVTTYWQNQRTRNALQNLTDRELDDIGLTRGDIERVARRGHRL